MHSYVKSFGLVVSLLVIAEAAEAAEWADLVVRHATVYTVNAKQPRASGFAIKGQRFVAVGSDDEMKALVGPDTKQLDLAGKTVVPGFIDAHAHPRPSFPPDSRWYSVEV